jgi:hypothetical protein
MLKLLLAGLALGTLQMAVTGTVLTQQLDAVGFRSITPDSIQAELQSCKEFTEVRISQGHVVRQKEAMQLSVISCILARHI